MTENSSFGLGLSQPELIEKLAVAPLKEFGAKVYVFGSRTRRSHHPFSDLDLLFEVPENITIPRKTLREIREKLEESRLAIQVDIVNDKELAEAFRELVHKEKIEF